MATEIKCDCCGHVESVTVDTPEPLAGWELTRSTNGLSVWRVCPACIAERDAQPKPSAEETLFVLDQGRLS
jgi:hypothetical protein